SSAFGAGVRWTSVVPQSAHPSRRAGIGAPGIHVSGDTRLAKAHRCDTDRNASPLFVSHGCDCLEVSSSMSSASQYDLIVIGGGPAGTAAAIVANRTRKRVLLLERGKFPRHKVCGEFVSAESLGLLKTLLDSQHSSLLLDAVQIPNAWLFLDNRTLSTVVDPPAASIARLDLDQALWDSADSSGVD